MRNGVVIGCVGVVAAAAVAMGVYMRPATPAPVTQESISPAPAPPRAVRPLAKPAVKPARAAEVATAAANTGGLPASYRVLLSRSIFCPRGTGSATAGKASEATLTLRGVVHVKRGYYAYVENCKSGEARRVQVGDTIGHKKVINIDFHSVEFVEGKRAMRVAVGQTFDPLSSAASTNSALATVHTPID